MFFIFLTVIYWPQIHHEEALKARKIKTLFPIAQENMLRISL